jgi:hypothetical protein
VPGFVYPFPRLIGIAMIEVPDRRFREWLAELCHVMLPFLVPDHSQALDISEVFDTELEVFPGRTGFPAVKVAHIEQQPQLSMLVDKPIKLGREFFVISLYQFFANVNDKHLPTVLFIELNWHFWLL